MSLRIFLGETTSDCIEDLRVVCRNAVYIDHLDKEYLPESASKPMAVLKALLNDRRKRGLIQLGIGIPILLASIGVIAVILLSDDISRSWKAFVDSGAPRLLFLVALGPVSSLAGIGNMMKAASLSKKLKKLQGRYPENLVVAGGIDMSEVHAEEI